MAGHFSAHITSWCFSLHEIKPVDLLGTGAMLLSCSVITWDSLPRHRTSLPRLATGWQKQLGTWANAIRSHQFLTEMCSNYSMLFFYQFLTSPMSNRSLLCPAMPHPCERDSSVAIDPCLVHSEPLCTPLHSLIQFEGCSVSKSSILRCLCKRSFEIFISLSFPHDLLLFNLLSYFFHSIVPWEIIPS